jgi:serine/threonine-protein kinase RsbW
VATLWVRHASISASVVRRTITTALAAIPVSEDEAFDAALIASELVGNAVRHAPALPSGQLIVEWDLQGNVFKIAVTDGGGEHEVSIKQAESWDTTGRGLAIVASIADDWGVTVSEGETKVWAKRVLASAPGPAGDRSMSVAS